MEHRPFGQTGLSASAVGFGCWEIGGGYGSIEETEFIKAVNRALDIGINSFDTAEVAVTPYIAYCTAKPQPKGCSATVLASLHDDIVNKGRPARKALEQWAAGNSGTGDITTLYNTLTSATSAINTIAQQNGIKS